MLMALPALELLDLNGSVVAQMPPGQVLVMNIAAIIWLLRQKLCGLQLLWFVVTLVWIACLVVSRRQIEGNLWSSLQAIGIVIVALLLTKYVKRDAPRYEKYLAVSFAIAVPALSLPAAIQSMVEAISQLPVVYDRLLFRFDSDLGLGWISSFAVIMNYNFVFRSLFVFNYNFQVMWIFLAAFSESFYAPPGRNTILLMNMWLGYAGFFLYCIMPAVGPAVFFEALFPAHLPAAGILAAVPVVDKIVGFRNAMPSLHAAASLLIWRGLRHSPCWHRSLGLCLIISTLVSTLGLGEHYAVDWVAAFPVVLWARGLSTLWVPVRVPERRNAILVGVLLTAGWVAVVRYGDIGLDAPWLIRSLALLSILLPALLDHRLARIGDRI
jgi:hypothetical protein